MQHRSNAIQKRCLKVNLHYHLLYGQMQDNREGMLFKPAGRPCYNLPDSRFFCISFRFDQSSAAGQTLSVKEKNRTFRGNQPCQANNHGANLHEMNCMLFDSQFVGFGPRIQQHKVNNIERADECRPKEQPPHV
jgi:hypothetical protein